MRAPFNGMHNSYVQITLEIHYIIMCQTTDVVTALALCRLQYQKRHRRWGGVTSSPRAAPDPVHVTRKSASPSQTTV